MNVVFILADDLGWSDVTLHGTTRFYQTPHVERLASRGMTFTRAYAASPLCSPTRASILTGLSPARHGITAPVCHLPQVVLEATAGNRASVEQKAVAVKSVTRLHTDYQTLPKSLKQAGYVTGHFGKWHLGPEPYSPLEHGFDVDVPHHSGPGPAGSYVAPWKFKDFDHDPETPNQHIEDRMAIEASEWIEQHQHEPFFLNYWMFSVHAPFDARKSLIEKYRTRVNPDDPQRSPTYAAMIESMDDAVGTLLDTLDRLELAERTIIVFASDNGGNMYNSVDGTTPTSNMPLRGGKATMYEGGVRGPCVIVWPTVVQPGSRSESVIQSCDFYPSLLEMLEIAPLSEQQFDGMSIVPALRGDRLQRDSIFTYFPHNPRVPDWLPPAVSVHSGNWKLIRIFHGGEDGEHSWKLFHLADDVSESNDLAAQRARKVHELDALITGFLDRTSAVLPKRNDQFDPTKFRPELIGQPTQRKTRRQTAGKAVAGWSPSGSSQLVQRDSSLIVTSTGRDPFITHRLSKQLPAGAYKVAVTISSNAQGSGQLFWEEQGVAPKFFRDRSVSFNMKHDGEPHDYQISFRPAHRILSLRLDPAQGAGTIQIRSMKLLDHQGQVVHEWKF